MPEPLYIRTKEFSEMLGVTQETVRQQCASGKIPGAKRFGATWLIPKSFVETYVPSESKPKQVRKRPEELEILKKPTVFDEIRELTKAK